MTNPTTPQPLAGQARERLQNYLLDELDRGIRQTFQIATDYPGFLADPAPAPPVYRMAKALARQACRAWARGQTPIRGAAADAVYGPLCEPYLDSIGEMPAAGELAPPFEGGQCPGVQYRVSGSYRVFSGASCELNADTLTFLGFVTGPIQRFEYTNGTQAPPTCSQSPGRVFRVVHAGGVLGLASSTAGGLQRITNISVSRVDGQPDLCGNPPPEYTPPRTVPGLPPVPPITVDLPGIGPVDVNVEFNPDGTVTVSLPDLGIEVTKGDPADTRPVDGLPPGDQGEPGSPGVTGAGGDVEGEAPPGYVLVGLRLNLLTVPAEASQWAQGVYRGACYVYMGGSDGLDQDFAGAFIRDGQFIFAEKKNLTRWRVSANSGYNIRTTPYYTRADV